MTDSDKEVILQWLQKAEHDLIAAEILIEANPIILDIACFHCQQAIEKYLKAFLIFNKHDFIFTHNLDFLAQQCATYDADFLNLDMKNINLYAVRARYPHDYNAPELAEAQEYYQISIDIKSLVIKKIQL
jgi:HEPN domain-containing protein